MAVVVRSLEEIKELEVQVGVGAEVEVEVRGPLLKLCDAPAMRNLLKKLVRDKGWEVVGALRLEPLIPVAQAVNEANKKVSELLPLFDTDKTPLTLAANARNLRRRTNGLSYYATELQRLGKEVLGEATSLGDDLEEIVTCIRARKATIRAHSTAFCRNIEKSWTSSTWVVQENFPSHQLVQVMVALTAVLSMVSCPTQSCCTDGWRKQQKHLHWA